MKFLKVIKLNLSYFLKIISGKYRHLYTNITLNVEWFGTHYGGFYLFPEVLKKKPVILSFGIGQDLSFDRAVSDRFACQVICFDPTPKSINWIKNQNQDLVKGLVFFQYGISEKTQHTKFFLPNNEDYVSGSVILRNDLNSQDYIDVELKSIVDICLELNIKHIDVLKMDIEGAEYNVLKNLIATNIFVGQILVEFHDRMFSDGFLKSRETVKIMKDHGYKISAHSKSFEEVSFIHSSLSSY
jgi:FkbM family methyltransferase